MKKAIKLLAMGLMCLLVAAACDPADLQKGNDNDDDKNIVGIWIYHDNPGVHFVGFEFMANGSGYYFECLVGDEEAFGKTPFTYVYNHDTGKLDIVFAEMYDPCECEVLSLTDNTLNLKIPTVGNADYDTATFTRVESIPALGQ